MFTFGRVLTITVAALATVVQAHAQSIFLDSFGTFTNTYDGGGSYTGWSQSESLLYPPTSTGGYADLTTLSGSVTDPAPSLPYGTYTYSDATGDSLTVSVDFTSQQYDPSGDFYSASGTWSFVSGTGSYQTVSVGEGTISLTQITGGQTGSSGTLLAGVLTPAPEPISMSLLGVGALALIRRKRKA